MNQPIIRVTIAGLGTIGSGVAAVIQEHQRTLPIRLVKILEAHKEGTYAKPFYEKSPELFAENLEEILDDPQIDVIVETIGGRTFAKSLIEGALKKKKHVISANKDLIATDGQTLTQLAQQTQTHFLFEASVGGAIPIIRLMENYFSLGDIQEVSGILNGTTNYILSEMDARNVDFETVLKEAQAQGFAEQDPTNDVKGNDARYKITILMYLVTGQWVPVEAIHVEGIDALAPPDFDYAARRNRKIKLVAHFSRTGNQLQAFVLPLMIPQEATLAKITGSTNIVTVQGAHSDAISLIGQGAGSHPTASAIVADIYKTQDFPVALKPTEAPDQALAPFSEYLFQHTLRFDINDQPGIVGQIGAILAKYGINIYALEQLPQYHHREGNREKTVFHLTLEACKEGLVNQALDEINAAKFLASPVFVLRELCR